ncbi:hypothetical protein AB1K62_02910 [Parasphingorhabdus sp. JC815]|uniref:hypothetical protein n=1 Tax=Parasphingorhabdus sp. JC815 TaxID=3232140 RepID=UPI00345A8A1B
MVADTDNVTPASKASPARTTAKKKTGAKKTTPKKSASTKSASTKDTSVKKTTHPKPAAPLKAGSTRAASTEAASDNDLKNRAINSVRTAANEGKTKAGAAIGGLSEMIEGSAKSLDDSVGEKYGNYARSTADAVSSFADKVNSTDVDEMVEEAREFVRKKPAVAIGAAAVVGLLVARLIKSGMDDRA